MVIKKAVLFRGSLFDYYNTMVYNSFYQLRDSLSELGTSTICISIAILLFMIVIMWLVYKKAGHPGWAAIIPFYNLIVGLRIAGKPWWWVFGILLVFIPIFGLLLFVVEHICISYGISKNFGQATGFTVGLTLLPFLFYPILAFGKYQWSAEHKNV